MKSLFLFQPIRIVQHTFAVYINMLYCVHGESNRIVFLHLLSTAHPIAIASFFYLLT